MAASVKEVSDVHFSPEPASKNSESKTRGSRRSMAGIFLLTLRFHAMARRPPWHPRPTSASFDRHGIIFCPENKDVVLFPERIDGQYVGASSTQRGDAVLSARDVGRTVAGSDPLGPARCLHGGGAGGRPAACGAGTPPVQRCRWLGRNLPRQPPADPARRGRARIRPVSCCSIPKTRRRYCAARRIRSSSRRPTSNDAASCPTSSFPRESSSSGDSYLIYYGAADSCTAVVEFSTTELLDVIARRSRESQVPGRSARSSTDASNSGRWLPIKSFVPSDSSIRTPRLPRAINAFSPSRPDRIPQNP